MTQTAKGSGRAAAAAGTTQAVQAEPAAKRADRTGGISGAHGTVDAHAAGDALPRVDLSGFRPARQARSQALLDRWVEVALALLQQRDFDAISIGEICEAAGVSVGSFYTRFDSKEAFFRYLQHVVVQDSATTLDASRVARFMPRDERDRVESLRAFLAQLVRHTVTWYQRHEGLIRASLRLAQTRPEAWEPLRALGAHNTRRYEAAILQITGSEDDAALRETVGFALQSLIGTCNNMVMVNPAPFSIRGERTQVLLVRAMAAQIEAVLASSR